MREVALSKFGLVTVAEACAANGWAPKTVQNWVKAGLLSAVPVGSGRGTLLLVAEEVKGFTPPPRGRPKKDVKEKPAAQKAKKTGR